MKQIIYYLLVVTTVTVQGQSTIEKSLGDFNTLKVYDLINVEMITTECFLYFRHCPASHVPAVPVLPVPPLLLVVGQRQLHQRRLLPIIMIIILRDILD